MLGYRFQKYVPKEQGITKGLPEKRILEIVYVMIEHKSQRVEKFWNLLMTKMYFTSKIRAKQGWQMN